MIWFRINFYGCIGEGERFRNMNCSRTFVPRITSFVEIGRLLAKNVIIFAFLFLFSNSASAGPLRFVFSDSYAPLSWHEEGVMQGIIIDILDATLKSKMNVEASYSGYPWKRAQVMVKSGAADAFVTVPTKARREYTTCSSEPAITVDVSAYTYIDNPRMNELLKVQSYADLAGFEIIDYLGNDWAKNKFKNMSVNWASNLESSYRMLAARRGDVLVRNSFNFDYFSRHLDINDKIVKLPTALSSVAFHLCIRKQSPMVDLLPLFDETIQKFYADGSFDKITARYRQQ